MPKRDIRMTPAEVTEFLSQHAECVIAFNDGRRAPGIALAQYRLRGDRMAISVPRSAPVRSGSGVTAMLAALGAEPRVCVLVEQSPTYYEIAYVAIRGPAEAVHDADGELAFELPVGHVSSASFAKLLAPTDLGTA
jgi:nitroimidazol reductase NimA-like FMN-containing flavoprotein (pyridoxamine 5'-phosphate oxidase superfamily)